MDINNKSIDKFIYFNNKFNPKNVSRCANCNLIPYIQLFYENNQPLIYFYCEKNHEGNMLLKDYINIFNKFSLTNEKCQKCNKNFNEDLIYFSKDFNFLCNICKSNQLINDKKEFFNLKKYDGLCKIHFKSFDSYCIKCKKNLFTLSKLNYSNKFQFILNEGIKNLETKIKNLYYIKQNIISEINKLIETNEIEINFIKILL